MRLFLKRNFKYGNVASFLLAGTPATAATATQPRSTQSALQRRRHAPGDGDLYGQRHGLGDFTQSFPGLPPGEHGFHIHEKGDCGPGMNQGKLAAGFAAGGHYDPAHTKKHLGAAQHRWAAIAAICRCWWWLIAGAMRPKPSLRPILQWRRFATARSWFILAATIIPTPRRPWAVVARA